LTLAHRHTLATPHVLVITGSAFVTFMVKFMAYVITTLAVEFLGGGVKTFILHNGVDRRFNAVGSYVGGWLSKKTPIVIEMGLIVRLGVLISLIKMPWPWKTPELLASLIMFRSIRSTYYLHWGIFSRVMVATVGALACSLVLSGARCIYEHIDNGVYITDYFDISGKL
jgi:hypothetical protein